MLLHSCTTTENRSTCCPTIKRSLNLLPPEVDKATSPGAGDNMRPIVGEGGVLGEQQHGGINQRIPRMPRATGFNYSGGAPGTRIASDCICRREKLKPGMAIGSMIYSKGFC